MIWNLTVISTSLPTGKLLEICMLALPLLQMQSVIVCKFMYFLDKVNLVPVGMHNFVSFSMMYRLFYLLIYFNLSSSLAFLSQFQLLSQLQQCPVPMQLPFPVVVVVTYTMFGLWVFYFWVLIYSNH